jgi:radical SAM-linked protein
LRMMAVFEKSQRLRHVGHLDIMRSMQRALRRSGLPVSYSNGFNPHILLTFASPLSVGAVGKRELMEVTLYEDVTPEQFLADMNKALPPEMQLSAAKVLEDKHPALMAMVKAARYDIEPEDAEVADLWASRVQDYLAQDAIMTMRKTKSGMKEIDIRPLIHSLACENGHLHAVLALTETVTCKPDMLLSTLCEFAGCEVPRVALIREGLLGEDAEGQLVPLESL